MGSAASTYPLYVDLETFRTPSGDSFHQEIFDAFKNESGLLSREKFLELISIHLHVPQFEVAFSAYVKNGMRVINVKQLEELMKSIGHFPSAEDLYDPLGERLVSFPDFINIMIRKLNKMDSELLATFEMFDVNHNGFVSAQELKEVLHQLGEDVSEEDAAAMVVDADIDGDGLINIDEFQQKIFPSMQGLDNSLDPAS